MKFHYANKSSILTNTITMALFAAMAMPASVLAQVNSTQKPKGSVHHYKLVDMGTLGGPNSFSAWNDALSINSSGTAIAEADTALGDPFAPFCLQGCLVDHGLQWKNGVVTDMGALPAVATPHSLPGLMTGATP